MGGANQSIKEKQRAIAQMVQGNIADSELSHSFDKDFFLSAFKGAKFDESTLLQFHGLLERESPDKHRTLLELLGFTEDEIALIIGQLEEE